MKKIRVAAYCRVSKGGAEPEHSLQVQISFYTDMIRSDPNYQFVGVYAEIASGLFTKTTTRGLFQRKSSMRFRRKSSDAQGKTADRNCCQPFFYFLYKRPSLQILFCKKPGLHAVPAIGFRIEAPGG